MSFLEVVQPQELRLETTFSAAALEIKCSVEKADLDLPELNFQWSFAMSSIF